MRIFRLTHPVGGSIEVIPSYMEERYCFNADGSFNKVEIAHLGWCQLFKDPATKRVLEATCNRLGTDKAKRMYTEQITIEEVK